jgi:formylglycine-generating enzyme required for sulfatase activity
MNKTVTRHPSLFTAALCAACLAWPRAASATSAVALTWNPGQYATISGNILTVDVPAAAADGTFYGARASFDLAQFEGRTLSASVLARAETLSEPERSTYGIKVMLHFTDPETGADRYPEAPRPAAPFEWRTMEVVDTVSGGARSARGRLWLGLQGVSGRVQFDLSTAEVVNGDPLFPQVNGDLTCAYTARVADAPQKRGVMLPGQPCTEKDFQTLCQWGATLVRYQMTDGPKPASGESTEAYLARYRAWLGGKLDHLDHDVLPWAVRYGMDVAVDLHTPPGGDAGRMLDDEALATEFLSLWRNIATRFKGRAGIYGYDLCNELNQTGPVLYDYWTIQRLAAEAIRAIDPETPIIIESNKKDSPLTFSYLSPLNLTNVIYELHMYEPGSYTHQGVAGEENFEIINYPREGRDKTYLQQVLSAARAFETAHGAKIYVGEFSAPCWAGGVETYLGDLIDIFGDYGWDWTYHAFREWKGWSVEHDWVKLGITPDCFVASADNPRKRTLLAGLSPRVEGAPPSDPQITRLVVSQDRKRRVTVSYHLDDTAYVTMDVLTNGVSIGGANVQLVEGDCNRLLPAGDHEICWDARGSWPDHKSHNAKVRLKAWLATVPPPVMDIDLVSKSVAWYADADFLPGGGLTNDIYRTTHLVMKKVPAAGATFTMGSPTDENPNRLASEVQHLVSFTNDYYLAIYETTRKQFALMGCSVHATYGAQDDPYAGDDPDQVPIGRIIYNNLRGAVDDGIDWPATGSNVGGYLATIRAATGLDLDIPTEAQWEFACRAGTATAMYNGMPNAGTWGLTACNDIAWYTGTSDNKPHAVGGKLPNDWGFYDMYGNVREWCLDWYATYGDSPVIDPNGPSSGTERVIRSSYYYDGSRGMRSAYRTSQYPNTANTTYGFRLCLPLP